MAENLFQNTNVPLGAQVEFVYQWSEWMKSLNQCIQTPPVSNDQVQSDQSNQSIITLLQSNDAHFHSNVPLQSNYLAKNQVVFKTPIAIGNHVSPDQNSISLSDVLNSNAYGKSLIEAYKQEKCMNEYLRNLLVDSVLQYCVANNHELSVADCASLSNEIPIFFAGEIAVDLLYSLSHIFLS